MFSFFYMQKYIFSQKSGQAAMEFLMTYGWALLIVLISVGALTYLTTGFSAFTTDSCMFPPGFSCINYQVSQAGNTVFVTLQNGLGRSIDVDAVLSVSGSNTLCDGSSATYANTWSDGESVAWTISCTGVGTPLLTGDLFKGFLTLDYTFGGLAHTKEGHVIAHVEP